MGEVTRILENIEQGDRKAADELLPLVYEELRKLAAAKMASQPAGHTLQPTALVHEAWLRLAGADAKFEGRTHFFAAAAEAMRHILVDHARRKSALRHGGGQQRVEFNEAGLAAPGNDDQILAVNDALEKLAGKQARRRIGQAPLFRRDDAGGSRAGPGQFPSAPPTITGLTPRPGSCAKCKLNGAKFPSATVPGSPPPSPATHPRSSRLARELCLRLSARGFRLFGWSAIAPVCKRKNEQLNLVRGGVTRKLDGASHQEGLLPWHFRSHRGRAAAVWQRTT